MKATVIQQYFVVSNKNYIANKTENILLFGYKMTRKNFQALYTNNAALNFQYIILGAQ